MSSRDRVAVRRTYSASPADVFRAFTEPEMIVRWWSPDAGIPVRVRQWDLRAGGRWSFAYHLRDGTVSVVTGVFREIVPGARLSFTWTWEPPDRHAGVETLVTIALAAAPQGTELTLAHERFPDAETCERHDAGWRGTLDRLQEVLG